MTKLTKKIHIEVTEKQLKELLLATMLYSWIRGGLADRAGEEWTQYEQMEKFLLRVADKHGCADLAETFMGKLIPSTELYQLIQDLVEEYDDDAFWHELTMRLGKRDFFRTMTDEEVREMEGRDWLPERVHEIYEKYEEEFSEHGLGRIKISENEDSSP